MGPKIAPRPQARLPCSRFVALTDPYLRSRALVSRARPRTVAAVLMTYLIRVLAAV
jgi:hypothetical protein